ncbi:ribonuclease III [Zavarzinia sp. CC-PAN008]|uniref:ribonuclease III n=1 Tax=Zavarzinia sp. CC-PAN008 TaxID=3243332 RepID=UPI003F746C1F
MPEPHLRTLEEAIGHGFRNPDLLKAALTHGSVEGRPSNQRLEFLGDRVLGLVIAAAVFRGHPGESEGEMALRYNALVRGAALAAIARDLKLGRYILMSRAEAEQGGRDKPAILSDAMEAVIAAAYLDGGFAVAEALILRLWEPYLSGMVDAPKDPKTALQELAAARGLGQPAYRVAGRTGPDHAPVFTVVVEVGDDRHGEGQGQSKRSAEVEAAKQLLAQLAHPPRSPAADDPGAAPEGRS